MNNFKKYSVLIISDFPNWAYHEIQLFITQHLQDEYDFYYDFVCYNTKTKSRNPKTIISNYFQRKKYSRVKSDQHYDLVVYLAFYFAEQMENRFSANKIIKGIFTDGFPPSNSSYCGDIHGFLRRFLTDTDAVVGGSQSIVSFYKPHFPNVYFANSIINERLFSRKTKRSSDTFVIGWSGNPKRGFKGYYSHILPAIEILKSRYGNIDFISRFAGPMETLPNFYEKIDLVVIASDADAGPALFGEASLMDIPCVSTRIGWPNEVIQDGINGLFVERDIQDIVLKVESLYNNRLLLQSMSKRIRSDYQHHFSQNKMVDNWRTLFNDVINK